MKKQMNNLVERKIDFENYLSELEKNEKYTQGDDYQLKEGDIILHESNTFFLIMEISKDNCKCIVVTPHHSLCDQRCAIFKTDKNLLMNTLWGATPFIYRMKISEAVKSILVGKARQKDFKIIKVFSEGKKIPESYRGLGIDLDADTYQCDFFESEKKRFEAFNSR